MNELLGAMPLPADFFWARVGQFLREDRPSQLKWLQETFETQPSDRLNVRVVYSIREMRPGLGGSEWVGSQSVSLVMFFD